MQRTIAAIEQIRSSLERANTLEELKRLRDEAEIQRVRAKQSRLGLQVHNQAAELKLVAERKAGAILTSLRLKGGDRKSQSRKNTPTLEELRISKHDSRRWQLQAQVHDTAFYEFVAEMNSAGKELTSAACLRLSKRHQSLLNSNLKNGNGFQTDANTSSFQDLSSVLNRMATVRRILQPLCETGSIRLREIERHILSDHLQEITNLLDEVQANNADDEQDSR